MLGWLFWTKGQWFPWWLVFSCCLIPWLFDFSVAWNHGPIKAVETEKGYVRFISQSQQKGVSGCWTNNVKKGVWHFRGRLMLPVWPVWPAAPSQRYFPQVLAWLFWFESIKCQGILSQQLVVLTRQISAMLWEVGNPPNSNKLGDILQQVYQLDQLSKQVHMAQTGLDCPQSYRTWLDLLWTSRVTAWERCCLWTVGRPYQSRLVSSMCWLRKSPSCRRFSNLSG